MCLCHMNSLISFQFKFKFNPSGTRQVIFVSGIMHGVRVWHCYVEVANMIPSMLWRWKGGIKIFWGKLFWYLQLLFTTILPIFLFSFFFFFLWHYKLTEWAAKTPNDHSSGHLHPIRSRIEACSKLVSAYRPILGKLWGGCSPHFHHPATHTPASPFIVRKFATVSVCEVVESPFHFLPNKIKRHIYSALAQDQGTNTDKVYWTALHQKKKTRPYSN